MSKYYQCPKCKGSGGVKVKLRAPGIATRHMIEVCGTCEGYGDVLWIDVITKLNNAFVGYATANALPKKRKE